MLGYQTERRPSRIPKAAPREAARCEWGRRWNCGGFENAELRSFSFDRVPGKQASDDDAADLTLEGPARLASRPTFINYALIVEPGEYALSAFNIKVARSVSDVGSWLAKRSELLKDGRPQGGSFKVAAGEIVCIGNFFLDCHQRSNLWRYYTEGSANFQAHVAQFKQKYPFLDLNRATYRLIETSSLGHAYEMK